jgi:DNA-binding IclR family transcriptional regulator
MQLLRRSTQVLRAIAENPGGMTLQELVNQLGLPLATMHRLLSALSEDQLVLRRPSDRRYVIGPMIHRLAAAWDGPASIVEVTRPHLQRLGREVAATAFVSQLLGEKVVCVALSESTRELRLFASVGQEMPPHAAAAARAILAFRRPAFARRALSDCDLAMYTSDTKTDIDVIMRSMPHIRSRGYDVCENEIDRDVWAVAAPIGSELEQVDASVTVAAPRDRFQNASTRYETITLVQAAARAICSDLGTSTGHREVVAR